MPVNPLANILPRITTLTFDCYGTLIDWDAGLWSSFQEILGPKVTEKRRELFEVYVKEEATIEEGTYKSYREILGLVSERVGRHFGVSLPVDRAAMLADQLPDWRPFADTNDALKRLKKRFRLGILSNIDRALFAMTARHFSVDFDFIVTAQDVRSYKPANGHFAELLAKHGKSDQVLHVAQSLYHDAVPAARFGIAFAWINRYNETNDAGVPVMVEFPGLRELADALEC